MSAKHPKAEPIHDEALLTGDIPATPQPVFYSELNGELVKKCALRTKGGAGVSQQEDVPSHKMLTGYKRTPPLPYAMLWQFSRVDLPQSASTRRVWKRCWPPSWRVAAPVIWENKSLTHLAKKSYPK